MWNKVKSRPLPEVDGEYEDEHSSSEEDSEKEDEMVESEEEDSQSEEEEFREEEGGLEFGSGSDDDEGDDDNDDADSLQLDLYLPIIFRPSPNQSAPLFLVHPQFSIPNFHHLNKSKGSERRPH